MIICLLKSCQLHQDIYLPLKIQSEKWILPEDSVTLLNSLSTVEEILILNDPFTRQSVIMIWWIRRKASKANRRLRQARGASYVRKICQDIRTTDKSFDFDLFNTYDKKIIHSLKWYFFWCSAVSLCIQVFYTCNMKLIIFLIWERVLTWRWLPLTTKKASILAQINTINWMKFHNS
jgi:hypothetical protein